MTTQLYTIHARHSSRVGQLPCIMSTSVTVEGEYARDHVLAALALRGSHVEVHWEVYHGTSLTDALRQLARHFEEYSS